MIDVNTMIAVKDMAYASITIKRVSSINLVNVFLDY